MIEHVIYFVPVDNEFVILLLNILFHMHFRVGRIHLPLTEFSPRTSVLQYN